MKFIPMWYNADHVFKVDLEIEAASKEEAVNKAYERYNGNPPSDLLYLEEVHS